MEHDCDRIVLGRIGDGSFGRKLLDEVVRNNWTGVAHVDGLYCAQRRYLHNGASGTDVEPEFVDDARHRHCRVCKSDARGVTCGRVW